jgi:SAM-dependent methyltransferase
MGGHACLPVGREGRPYGTYGVTMDAEQVNTLTLSILEEASAYNGWIFDKVRPWLGKGILEVGCGIGNLTGLLLEAGKVVASDLNPHHLQRVDEKFGSHPNLSGILPWDIQQDLSRDFPVSIDTILCSNVLEHVEDDNAVLSRFYRFLPQGGRLVLLVPALRILYNTFDRELGHFRRYAKRELIQKLERNHFHICSLKYFNFFGILGWFVNGTLLQRSVLPVRQVRVFNQLVPLMVQMERWVPTVIGQSLIAIGEKS